MVLKLKLRLCVGHANSVLSSTTNPERATYETAVHNVDGRRSPKVGYYMIIIDGRHWPRFVERVKNEDGVEWAAE